MSFQLPDTSILAGLTLRVRDLDAALAFYRDLLGLEVVVREDGRTLLAPGGRAFTLELLHDPGAAVRPARSLGLYHFALLLPDRAALAATVRRLVEIRWSLGGSDHGVSEALYLSDPEGNGIELYRDRPREQWPLEPDGDLAMVTARLDMVGLERENPRAGPLHPQTRFGHIHLHVDSLERGEALYAGGLGLRVMQRSYPGALFLSVGGYHHHLGLNLWGRGAAPPGATGLVRYTWQVPEGTVTHLRAHLSTAGTPVCQVPAGVSLTDPAGVEVIITEEPLRR
ncbi:MAG: VOC family protein [Armatimonadetes bacterium]|nr:VOC family protein [Armatimonadota bacterium]